MTDEPRRKPPAVAPGNAPAAPGCAPAKAVLDLELQRLDTALSAIMVHVAEGDLNG